MLLHALSIVALCVPQVASDAPELPPVRVYVLAGQSNMEGKAKVELLQRQARDEATRERFQHLVQGDGWRARDDVWIRFLDRHGPLTVGYGSPGCIGPELDFGWLVGDRTDAPVVLVKAAWGGKSLVRDFRPPSAGLPPAEELAEVLARERTRTPDRTLAEVEASYGFYYRALLAEVRAALADLGTVAPELAGREAQLAGCAWFQGWNDMLDARATGEYADNLACLIRDLRRDLAAPGLPFVVGQFGVGGADSREPQHLAFKAAQAAAVARPEFAGNVALVRTDVFWDTRAQEVFDSGWREHLEEWAAVGSDYPYHYLGSPRTYCDIGRALAEALLALGAERSPR